MWIPTTNSHLSSMKHNQSLCTILTSVTSLLDCQKSKTLDLPLAHDGCGGDALRSESVSAAIAPAWHSTIWKRWSVSILIKNNENNEYLLNWDNISRQNEYEQPTSIHPENEVSSTGEIYKSSSSWNSQIMTTIFMEIRKGGNQQQYPLDGNYTSRSITPNNLICN